MPPVVSGGTNAYMASYSLLWFVPLTPDTPRRVLIILYCFQPQGPARRANRNYRHLAHLKSYFPPSIETNQPPDRILRRIYQPNFTNTTTFYNARFHGFQPVRRRGNPKLPTAKGRCRVAMGTRRKYTAFNLAETTRVVGNATTSYTCLPWRRFYPNEAVAVGAGAVPRHPSRGGIG